MAETAWAAGAVVATAGAAAEVEPATDEPELPEPDQERATARRPEGF